MKKILLTSVLISFLHISGFSQTVNKETLCKKWYLEKYEVMWVDYEPDEKEKNDYLLLKSDMTYVSLDKGIETSGKWTFNIEENYFTMFNEKGDGIKMIVDKLSINKMVFKIDIKEMDGVGIHYTATK
jgi:hypothetical protein